MIVFLLKILKELVLHIIKLIKIFMGSNTNDTIDKIFDTLLQRFQEAMETSNERGG